MHPNAYGEMAATEQRHWWFAGRRAIISSVLDHLDLPTGARILEIGAGTGGNLEMLSGYGRVCAVEMCQEARMTALSTAGSYAEVRLGAFPQDDPVPGERFALICMLDVLEHMADDVGALEAARSRLAPGGRVLLTVPAYPWLWSRHDEYLHHCRRYTRRSLLRLLDMAGFRTEMLSSMNMLLLPLLCASRLLDRLRGVSTASGTGVPPAPLNALFRVRFSLERFAVPVVGLPWGASLLAVLEPMDE